MLAAHPWLALALLALVALAARNLPHEARLRRSARRKLLVRIEREAHFASAENLQTLTTAVRDLR